MINNLLKISALIVTGKFLKPRFKGLIALVLFWFVVSFMHDEYVSYVEISGDSDFLLQSSIIKISLYFSAFLVYLILVERKLLISSPREKTKPQPSNNKAHSEQNTSVHQNGDGFDFLRNKKKLENSTDKLLK